MKNNAQSNKVESYNSGFYSLSEYTSFEIQDGNFFAKYVDPAIDSNTDKIFGTNGDAILMLDENYEPIKIYVNL